MSDKAPIDVRSAVQGLLTYPYGCGEQTTSTAYPHVFIDEAAAKQFGLKPYTQAQRAEMLDKAIARLAGMQAPNGGFSLWGNLSEYQYWLSAYVSNFLIDAREQGFNVPPEVEKRALGFLLKGLQEGLAGEEAGFPRQLQPGEGIGGQSVVQFFDALEADRSSREPWWAGASPGHPDIAVACVLRFLSEAHPDVFDPARWPSLAAHARTCEALPAFEAVTQPFLVTPPQP